MVIAVIRRSLSEIPFWLTCFDILSVLKEELPNLRKDYVVDTLAVFGSYARGDAVEDVTKEGNTTYEYSSDFDILAIVKSKNLADNIDLWNDIEDKAGKLPVETPVRLIAHDIGFISNQLKKGQYFFSDIKKEGIILHDSGQAKLARRKTLDPAERAELAKEDFKHWFKSAREFLIKNG